MVYFWYMKKTTDTTRELVQRLNRVEGQINALKRSLEEGNTDDCTQTLYQLKAATNGLKRFGEAFARAYAKQCIREGKGAAHLTARVDQIISTAFTLA